MKSDPKKLLNKHDKLVHSENMKVSSHVQRKEKDSEWIVNTLMIEGYEVPFRYRRNKPYKDIKGARVNLTYYPVTENVAGFEMEYMKVIRIKIA